jgi:hypothetical protein
LVETGFHFEPFAHDGNQNINRNGDPDLCLQGVLAGSLEGLDAQTLLDPFEEQLHLPAPHNYHSASWGKSHLALWIL